MIADIIFGLSLFLNGLGAGVILVDWADSKRREYEEWH